MKEMPAALLAVLSKRDTGLLHRVFGLLEYGGRSMQQCGRKLLACWGDRHGQFLFFGMPQGRLSRLEKL